MTTEAAAGTAVRVWDVPTRLVHWSLVALFACSWWTAETDRLEWHRWSGYGLLGLLSFRIFWGFCGSSTARFSQFVRGPRSVVDYLRGRWMQAPGHSPLGALSVVLLLILLLAQISLGLFAIDVDGIESGPLSMYVSFEAGRRCAGLHNLLFNVLLVVIGLHIAAVLFYLVFRKQNLIGAMITGRREFPVRLPPVVPASAVRLIVGIALAAGLTWMVARAFQFP